MNQPFTVNELLVFRAKRILEHVLPEIRNHDHAVDHLFYVHLDNPSIQLISIAAAIYILKEAKEIDA